MPRMACGTAYLLLLRLALGALPFGFLDLPALALAAASPAAAPSAGASALSALSPGGSPPGAAAPSLGMGLPMASNVLFRHSVDLSTHFCHSFGASKNAYDFWRYSRFTYAIASVYFGRTAMACS